MRAPRSAAYSTSKHGVRGMTRQMALELAPHDIRVLGIAPTYCVTEGNVEAAAANVKAGIDMAKEVTATAGSRLGRVGVADAALLEFQPCRRFHEVEERAGGRRRVVHHQPRVNLTGIDLRTRPRQMSGQLMTQSFRSS